MATVLQSQGACAEPGPSEAIDEARRRALRALDTPIGRAPLPALYRSGVVLVSVVMLLLPLIYVGLIVALGWGLWWHAAHHASLLGAGNARGNLVLYAGPLLAGALLLLFMIKPLLARRAATAQPKTVARDRQPFLFAFVEKLCRAVGAPAPRRIDVDCQVNASAGFHSPAGLFDGGRVLTIGLPLARHLSLRELAGVLAHEFGHFAQGTGTRLHFMVSTINAWFHRVVNERDAWDERLAKLSKHGGGYPVLAAAWTARLLVWLTRRILCGLMCVAHALSCFLCRQMEYDADRYEIELAGSTAFENTARRLQSLGVASAGARLKLQAAWSERRLADDLPELIGLVEQGFDADMRANAGASIDGERSHVFATHPRTIDRIERARAAARAGTFDVDAPASVLFDGFGELCREVTRLHYGEAADAAALVPAAALAGEMQRTDCDQEAHDRYLHGGANFARPLVIDTSGFPAAGDLDATRARLAELRTLVASHRCRWDDADRLWSEAIDRRFRADLAACLLEAKVRIAPRSFGLRKAKVGAARAASEQARKDLQRIQREHLGPLESIVKERLQLALALLKNPELATVYGDVETARLEIDLFCDYLDKLRPVAEQMLALRREVALLTSLFETLQENTTAKLRDVAAERVAALHENVRKLHDRLEGPAYPLAHGKGAVLLSAYAFPHGLPTQDPEAVVNAVNEADEQLRVLYLRVIGRICAIAEEIENALELESRPPSGGGTTRPSQARPQRAG